MESQTTRQRLLEAAITLMRRSGLSGAGINEIVRESGAPKGSVYHFFPGGKQQIVAEALRLHTERVAAWIEETMGAKRTPASRVKALFDAYALRFEQGDARHSCPSGTVCLDLEREMEALRMLVAETFDRYIEAMAGQLELGNRERERALAAFMLTAIQGAFIRARAEKSGRPFREAGAWLAATPRGTSAAARPS